MTSVRTLAAPGRRPVWLRALLVLVTLLGTALAATGPVTAATAPAAVVSVEPGELHQDAPDTALRLPTGHATRLPAARTTLPVLPARPSLRPARPHAPRATLRALRCVVLRC